MIKFDTKNKTPLTEGGEGYIYEHNGKIIKVFKPNIDTTAKERKITALMKATLPKAVITPLDTVSDTKGRFIGYCMEKVTGEEFKRLSNRKFVTANNITTKDIFDLLVKLKAVLAEIHKQNIFIGDLNDQNVLFDMSGNIYLIDCDSWAVENDKCTVAMDLFKDPKLKADNFNADTDNYAFMVLAWKCLTRVHPFGGTVDPDMPILERMRVGRSVVFRKDVILPRTTRHWRGFSPDLQEEFQDVFENGLRTPLLHMEDNAAGLVICKKCKEYFYGRFSSCPYCDSTAQVNKKPVSQGSIGGLKLYAIYDGEKIKAVFDRYTYLDNGGFVHSGNQTTGYFSQFRYHYTKDGIAVLELSDCVSFRNCKDYLIEKKYKSTVEVNGNSVYYISPKDTLTRLEIMPNGNGIKNICKVSNTAYFAVSGEDYCVVNYYTGKIIVNVSGTNTIIDYDSDIMNYGIHKDEITGKWLVVLEDGKGVFNTFVIDKGAIEYKTDGIKYACQLNCPCIYNSNIFIPIDGKIRGYSYKKSQFKDFECSVVSEESKLIKEKNRFVIVNLENVYYLEG